MNFCLNSSWAAVLLAIGIIAVVVGGCVCICKVCCPGHRSTGVVIPGQTGPGTLNTSYRLLKLNVSICVRVCVCVCDCLNKTHSPSTPPTQKDCVCLSPVICKACCDVLVYVFSYENTYKRQNVLNMVCRRKLH